jgi:hypothetical protein
MIFKGDKNPQHTFLRMGSKAGRSHVLRFYGILKISRRISDTDTQNSQSVHSYLLPDVSAGSTDRELW